MKSLMRRDDAREIAEKLMARIPHMQWLLCGSYARGRMFVGDLDIVVVPAFGFNAALIELFGRLKGNPLRGSRNGDFCGAQVNIFEATDANWEAQVLTATGSGKFNMIMRARAKERGLKLNQYGLWSGGVLLTTKEREIFRQLDFRYHEPAERDK